MMTLLTFLLAILPICRTCFRRHFGRISIFFTFLPFRPCIFSSRTTFCLPALSVLPSSFFRNPAAHRWFTVRNPNLLNISRMDGAEGRVKVKGSDVFCKIKSFRHSPLLILYHAAHPSACPVSLFGWRRTVRPPLHFFVALPFRPLPSPLPSVGWFGYDPDMKRNPMCSLFVALALFSSHDND